MALRVALVALVSAVAVVGACGGDDSDGGGGATSNDGGVNGDGTVAPGTEGGVAPGSEGGVAPGSEGGITPTPDASVGGGTAAGLAHTLRGKTNFLIGMGNDLANDHSMDGAYTLGVTMDLHYTYLVGLQGEGGWPDWNAGGSFVNIMTDSADAKGTTPMFTLYAMAAHGDGNIAVVTDDAYMTKYWAGAKLMFQRIGMFGKPTVVHLEPDFWGYAIQKSSDGTSPVHIAALAPDCAGVTEDFRGMAKCLLKLGRLYAPKAALGFHVSSWGADAAKTIAYFKAIGATDGDFIATDMLDRDAGCFEAATDPNCMRGGSFYWDESNQTSPNFHEHLAWVTQMTAGLKLPMMWWQVPFGVPSTTPGGTSGHYRDNRVHYMFSHMSELVAAGGVGAAFGTGAGNQTYIDSDGNQFKTAVGKYFMAPQALP